MTEDRGTYAWRAAIFALSICISVGVLNRWLVTELGVQSYGRIWQLYISYADFGFTRRALVGTALSVSGLNSLIGNEYHFAILIHHLLLLVLSAQVFRFIVKSGITDIPLVATILLSPALIIQAGYTTGSLDIFILILATLNILYVREKYAFLAILVVGILVHELFFFTVPAQVAAYIIHHRRRGMESFGSFYVLVTATVCACLFLVSTVGVSDLPRAAVESIMEERIPNAARRHSLWSGYFEISRSASENAMETLGQLSRDIASGYRFLLIPLAYVALVTARLVGYVRDRLARIVLVASTAFPFLVTPIATDIYRWVGLSASLGLLLTLSVLAGRRDPRAKLTYALLPFSIMAPFGASQLDWPFPAFQFVLAAMTRG